MSDAISRRIKQLENQNKKFKKLLESTRQITSEDTAKCLRLKDEATFLKKVVSDLENQKKQLEDELKLYVIQDECDLRVNAEVDIQSKLNNALNDIQRGSTEIQQLKTEDEYLKSLIRDLESEKGKLLNDINLVKKANEENMALAVENLKLKQDLALLESQCTSTQSYSGQDLVKKLESLENLKSSLQADINLAKLAPDLLGISVENTVLELKISGLEKQKESILRNLRTGLLQAANEISTLHSNTSDDQLRRLLNELDIHKTILMLNLNDLKEMHEAEEKQKYLQQQNVCLADYCNTPANTLDDQVSNQHINVKRFLSSDDDDDKDDVTISNKSEPKPSASFSSSSSEIIQQVTEIREAEEPSVYDQGSHDLPTVSEEDEPTNDLLAEREQLIDDINRLECERAELLVQIEQINAQGYTGPNSPNPRYIEVNKPLNELHDTFMREESSNEMQHLTLDDATNQLYVNQEQLLEQRIRELQDDNETIRRRLDLMLHDVQSDKGDLEVLEEGERLIRGYKDGIWDDTEPK